MRNPMAFMRGWPQPSSKRLTTFLGNAGPDGNGADALPPRKVDNHPPQRRGAQGKFGRPRRPRDPPAAEDTAARLKDDDNYGAVGIRTRAPFQKMTAKRGFKDTGAPRVADTPLDAASV